MKIGLIPVNVGVSNVDQMVAIARKAEEVGVESVWTFEHVIVPVDYESKYPYAPSGKMGAQPDTNFVDPLIALTAVAASTSKIRLGTGVNILSQANPLLLAKQAASLDWVSQGRFMLGVGIGWLREEFHAMGTPFERRGARFDDYVEAMKKVWAGGTVDHTSDFLDWQGFESHPLPVQKPHLPVIIGGSAGKVWQRIAKLGEGWFAPTAGVEQLEPMVEKLRSACVEAGRDPGEVEITAMWLSTQGGIDEVKRYRDLGVSRLVLPLPVLGGGTPAEGMEKLADEIISKL